MTDTPTGVPGGRGPNGSLLPWQRPPFESEALRGNTSALKHGAKSERAVQPLAQEIITTAIEQCDYLQDPSYGPALLAWGRTEAKVELLHRWLDEHGLIDDEGAVRGAANLLARYEAQAANQRSRLGMDPLSRAKLRKETASTALDMAQLMAKAGGPT